MKWPENLRTWQSKIVKDVDAWRACRDNELGAVHVLTNGCFDILHYGHIELLQKARQLGTCLIVAVNSDESVRSLKGDTRPFIPEDQRLAVIASLEAVDFCFIFNDKRCDKIIRSVRPAIWVKGGGYTLETLDKDEAKAARSVYTSIQLIPMLANQSTTDIAAKMASSTKT